MPSRQQARPALKRKGGEDPSGRQSPRRVVIVAMPQVRTLDLFGPAEVFNDANRLQGGDPAYEVTIISGGADRVIPSHLASPVRTDRTYREHRSPVDTILVAGYDSPGKMRFEPGFLNWLRDQCGKSRRFGSVCTGALILAAAGLLDGRRATTHWKWCSELALDYRRVMVDPSPIFIRDGNCYTSAGVTTGIDLALALVEEDLGSSVALRVAQMMVVFLRRPGQSQFSATLAAKTSANRPLNDLLAWLPDNIRRDLSVDKLARRAAMSPRNFARLFLQEVGKTPGRHIEDLRLEAARRQLESTKLSLKQVAEASGFSSAEILRRAFRRRLRVTPGQYRASFGSSPAPLISRV
jgi:transcriptional regulator GlxA family with amidase domain